MMLAQVSKPNMNAYQLRLCPAMILQHLESTLIDH